MTFDQVIEHFGSVATVASKLDVSLQAVYSWKDGVPNGRQWELQAVTRGKLKAETSNRKTKAA